MSKWIVRSVVGLGVTLVILAAYLYAVFGGGDFYRDVSTAPYMGSDSLEPVLRYPEPLGNVAVSADGSVFFTVHPESHPQGAKLLRWDGSRAVPFPDAASQARLATPLGLRIDSQNRLWVIDHGFHGFKGARLLAFDVASGALRKDIRLPSKVASWGSFVQDATVDVEGRWLYAADVAFIGRAWGKKPGIIAVDTQTGAAHRVLSGHESVRPMPYIIRAQGKAMQFFGGLLNLQPGVDGIALSRDGQWLYYAAMAHHSFYRLPTTVAQNAAATPAQQAAAAQRVGRKPLSDGITTDDQGRIYLTDVEHGGVLRSNPQGQLVTLIRSDAIRWSDGFSWGPDGWLYVIDSAIPDQMLQSRAHMQAAAPYTLWRFKPGGTAAAGQ